jgi:hypothetical protein
MHLISTLLSLLLAFTFTSAIPVSEITGSATPILTDIGSISSDVVALRNIVIAWNGNVLGLAALELLLQQIGTDITAAAYAIASSGPFNLTDSNSILSAVTALVPTIVTLLGDLDAIVSLVIK